MLHLQQEEIPRVPIICTGNDFSTLYAPLIRDGRMEKFYWAPTREDRIGVAMGIFQVCKLYLDFFSRRYLAIAIWEIILLRIPLA